MKTKKCDMCGGKLDEEEPKIVISVKGSEELKEWAVGDICAASVKEFILEFQDDVKTYFQDQDEAWKLRHPPYLQRKLPEVPA